MPVAPTAAALVVVVAASPSQWRDACLRLPLLDLDHSRLRSVAKGGEGSVRSSESVVKNNLCLAYGRVAWDDPGVPR